MQFGQLSAKKVPAVYNLPKITESARELEELVRKEQDAQLKGPHRVQGSLGPLQMARLHEQLCMLGSRVLPLYARPFALEPPDGRPGVAESWVRPPRLDVVFAEAKVSVDELRLERIDVAAQN